MTIWRLFSSSENWGCCFPEHLQSLLHTETIWIATEIYFTVHFLFFSHRLHPKPQFLLPLVFWYSKKIRSCVIMAVSKNSVLTSSTDCKQLLSFWFEPRICRSNAWKMEAEDWHECESSWDYGDPVSKEKTLGSGEVNSTQGIPFTASGDSWQCVARIVMRRLI